MIRQIGLVILSMAVLCVGCKTISRSTININLDTSDRSVKTLAILRFDDKFIQDKAVKGLIMKTISNPDAGEMLADMMTDELRRWGKYHILSRSEVKSKIKASDAEEEELVKLKDYDALGKMLKVDAVVIGKIHKFGLSNMTVYARGNVSFTAECIDTKKGKVLWSMETNESAPYKDEVDLAIKVIEEAVEKLKKETK
ncbi:MAG TPA: GNA1162 family protein [Candidatus Wunengus sp. YC60]|uniref:GNA1162 family protein n=1 Tax=Candidatus Wunengus sp. YC60 TaxID=3367697 RepID=UPI00402A2469